MERRRLSEDEITEALAGVNGWVVEGDFLTKKLKFSNFAESLDFVNRVGTVAEAADHHPDITFGWGYAEIKFTTHDRGGITDVDLAIAKQVDEL